MDKSTLSNYGWIVIAVLVLAVMIALATPFGSFIEQGVRSTTEGLFDTSERALNVVGMSAGSGNFEDGYQTPNGESDSGTLIPEYNHNAPELHPTGTIPDGAYYVNLNTGTFYTEMPNSVSDGDAYLYGDYLYVYYSSNGDGWSVLLATEALGISAYIPEYPCTDTSKSFYGAILESINGMNVTQLVLTFENCINLIESPVIPINITSMYGTFVKCSSLSRAPIIPNGVTDMSGTFEDCTSLTDAPIIPNSVTDMSLTFMRCISLTGKIEINATLPHGFYADQCFSGVDMTNITLTGSSPYLNQIGATGNNWTPIS